MSAASPRRTLITGASKPLGIELVRQCLILGDTVYAACRSPARVPELAELRARYGGLELLPLDPADAASVTEIVPVLEQLTESLDLLVIGAAEHGPHDRATQMARDEELSTLSGTGLLEHYRRHAVSPLLLVRTLLPWLTHGDGSRVLVVSNPQGSLSSKRSGGSYATAVSAAALNMAMRTMANDLREEKIIVCIGSAGKAANSAEANKDDGNNVGNYADKSDSSAVPLEEIALGLLKQAARLPVDRSGSFIDWTGADRAW